jgi:hypothetical protein
MNESLQEFINDLRVEADNQSVDGRSYLPNVLTEAADTVVSLDARLNSALDFIRQFGDEDGAHHKQWALDQVVRILTGTPEAYAEWVKKTTAGEDGPDTYEWGEGIAP